MKEGLKEKFIFLSTSAAKRRSQRQKGRFINYLAAEFTKELIPCHLEQKKEGGRSALSKLAGSVTTTNLVVGDIKKAKKILVAGYDTPTKALFPIKYYPFSITENRGQEKLNLLLKNLVAFAVLALCVTGVVLSWRYSWPVRIAAMAAAFVLNYLSFDGLMRMGNWYNFNKNNGAVAVLYQMVDALGVRDGAVAYVFVDEVASSYMGYRHLQEYLDEKNRNAEVIILDCVSTGEEVFLAGAAKMQLKQEVLRDCRSGALRLQLLTLGDKEVEETPLSLFSKGMMIVSGSRVDGKVVVRNTRTGKDSEADLQQLEDLVDTLSRYCQGAPARD